MIDFYIKVGLKHTLSLIFFDENQLLNTYTSFGNQNKF